MRSGVNTTLTYLTRVTPPASTKVGVTEWDRLMSQLLLDTLVLHDEVTPDSDHGLLQRSQDPSPFAVTEQAKSHSPTEPLLRGYLPSSLS